jgi:hypothetical protein
MAVGPTRKSLTRRIFKAAHRGPLPKAIRTVEVACGAQAIRAGSSNPDPQQA